MKKLIGIIAFSSLIMMSCNEDFIDLLPKSTVSVDILFKTDKDFKDALNATYNPLQAMYQNFWALGDQRADDSQEGRFVAEWPFYVDYFQSSSADPIYHSEWQGYYQVIFRANEILSRIESRDESAVPNKAMYIGEANFLRALAYFDLVRIFGDVPIITKSVTIEEGYKSGRQKVNKVYDEVIIPDLLAAENALPLKYTGSDVGRPTSGAAKAILGRVYLTRGDFVNAEAKLKEVTTMGYALLPKYTDLFNYSKDEHHSEYIFDIEYEEGIGEGFSHTFIVYSLALMNFYSISTYDLHNYPTEILINLFDSRDQRKDMTVGIPGGFYNANSVFVPLNIVIGVGEKGYCKKYLISNSKGDTKANWKVIRYADVLLMLAEALNENGKTTEALTYLNQIRTRAGMPLYAALTQSQTRDAIVLERRLELSFEGVRWFDLVRTGKAYDVMKGNGMLPYMTVFPIPLSQVQLMNDATIFPQNEGY